MTTTVGLPARLRARANHFADKASPTGETERLLRAGADEIERLTDLLGASEGMVSTLQREAIRARAAARSKAQSEAAEAAERKQLREVADTRLSRIRWLEQDISRLRAELDKLSEQLGRQAATIVALRRDANQPKGK